MKILFLKPRYIPATEEQRRQIELLTCHRKLFCSKEPVNIDNMLSKADYPWWLIDEQQELKRSNITVFAKDNSHYGCS